MKNPTPTIELLIVFFLPAFIFLTLIANDSIPYLFKTLSKKSNNLYNNMCYDSWYGRSFKSLSMITPLLLLRTKTFWAIILLLIPTIMMKKNAIQTPLTSLYISLNAAGLFYLIFNLIPEVKQKCQAARQASSFIFAITSIRASIMHELTGKALFTEANQVITENLFYEIGSKLRNSYYDPSHHPSANTNSIFVYQIPIQQHTSMNNNNAKNMLDVMNQAIENYLSFIEKIKNVTYIEKLELYHAVCFLEEQMNEFKVLCSYPYFPITEVQLIAYVLSAPDKLNYYAQKELPKYVGDRFNLRIKLSKKEITSARELQLKQYF